MAGSDTLVYNGGVIRVPAEVVRERISAPMPKLGLANAT
jgi:hypothetical protein